MITNKDLREFKLKFIEDAVRYCGNDCIFWPFADNGVGYPQVFMNGKVVLVHRIVCEKVQGPPPHGKIDCAHSCGNGHLACITPKHLRWATRKENAADRTAHGRSPRGTKSASAKLTEEQVLEIFARSHHGETQRSLGTEFKVDQKTISAIRLGRSWSWLTNSLAAQIVGTTRTEAIRNAGRAA